MAINQFQTDTLAIEVAEDIVFTPDIITGVDTKEKIEITVPPSESGLYWVDNNYPKLFSLFDVDGREYVFQFWDDSYMEPSIQDGRYYVNIYQSSPAEYIANKLAEAINLTGKFNASVALNVVTIEWKTPGAVTGFIFTDPVIMGFIMIETVRGTGKCYHTKYRIHSVVSATCKLANQARDGFSGGPKMNHIKMKDWKAGTTEALQKYNCFAVDGLRKEVYFATQVGSVSFTYRPTISKDDLDEILTNYVSESYCNTIAEYAIFLAYQRDKEETSNDRLATYYRFVKQIKQDVQARTPDDVYGYVSFEDLRTGRG